MTGTEKQVGWAKDIQAKKLEELRGFLTEAAKAQGASEAEAEGMYQKIAEVFMGQTSAGWWIDCKDIPVEHLIDKVDADAMMGVGREKALGRRPLDF